MAAGDFYIRSNTSDTSAVPNAGGGNEDAHWDNLVKDEGGIVTYTDPNLQLDIGLYLVMYSEFFNTTNTTNNERIEIQGEIHTGSGVAGGYGQDFIRKSSGDQDAVVSGYMILDVTANNTDVFIRFYRTDNSTTGTVNRVPGHGGVIILELDDTDNYGFYSTSASEATSGTTERTLNLNTNDRQDTGFSRSGDTVTISNAGRYLMTYSLDVSQTATGREDVVAYLRRNGTTRIPGTDGYCYLRGADGCQDGAVTWIGIVDIAASDTVQVRWQCPTSATITAASGATLQMWQIPSGGDEAIMEATTGNYNAAADFTWDTLPHIDAASFTATAGNSNIDIDQRDHILAFATFAQDAPDTVQRGVPEVRFKVDEALSTHAAGMVYHRNSGGSGETAVTVASILPDMAANQSIEVRTDPTAASGAMNNDSGQFSVLSLESVFGPYTFAPLITDFNTTEQFNWGDINLVITGVDFGSTQGTGTVEFWDDQVGTTQVAQSIDSWSDTSIQIDTTQGALGNNTTVYLVVTADGGVESAPLAIQVGLIPYHELITDTLRADHYWRLNNTYDDTGDTGPTLNMTSGVVGTWTFSSTPLSDSNTHALNYTSETNRREIADSPNMNITISSQERTLAFWFQINNVQHPLAAIWKEGGGVQNLAFITGYGNSIMFQLADVAGTRDNVQCFSDFRLNTNRPYHICGRYTHTESPEETRLYIDGIEQTSTDGNPMTLGIFDSHSGDVTWGDPDNNLETGATDISYNTLSDAHISDFATWSDNSAGTNSGALDKTTEIQNILFRRGAVPDDTIVTNTEANMQSALDATPDARPDWPLSYRVEGVTGAGDFELVMNDKQFDSRITAHLEYRGGGTLTIVNATTSNFDINKAYATAGGTVAVINEVPITLTVRDITDNSLIENARVLLEADTGGPLAVGTDILTGLTNASGQLTGSLRFSSNQPVTGRVRRGTASFGTLYKTTPISGTVTSDGLTTTLFMLRDE